MTKRERVDAAFQQGTDEFDFMLRMLEQCTALYRTFSTVPPACSAAPPPYAPSLTGSLSLLSPTLEHFFGAFGPYAQSLSDQADPTLRKLCEERLARKAAADAELDQSMDHDKALVNSTVKHNQALLAAAKRVGEVVASSHGKKVSTKNLTAAWNQYCQALDKFMGEREALKLSTDNLELKMVRHAEDVAEMDRVVMDRARAGVLTPIVACMHELQKELARVAVQLEDSTKLCNADSDVASMNNGIRFCDDALPEFKRYEFKSPYYKLDRMALPPFKVEYFPVGAAVARADFTPVGESEVPLEKGRRVFLMEAMRSEQPWTMVMTCGWRRIGFVPTAYLDKTRGRLAAVNRNGFKPANAKFLSTKLPFVAMLEEVTKGVWLCEDELFVRDKVAMQFLLPL